ncbi:hypothetical protein PG984_014795 [Apiospora sp. TS-2023a]
MPSEAQQSNASLSQPWKQWYPELMKAENEVTTDMSTTNRATGQRTLRRGGGTQWSTRGGNYRTSGTQQQEPSRRGRYRMGTSPPPPLRGGGNHGTTALEHKLVDIESPKEKPTIKSNRRKIEKSRRVSGSNSGNGLETHGQGRGVPQKMWLVCGLHEEALRCLFSLSADHVTEWDGILAYFHHMESCFIQLLDPRFNIIWTLVGHDLPTTPVDVWRWCFLVIHAFQSSSDPDPSVDRIYRAITEELKFKPTDDEKSHVLQAIFAVLCWASATLKPIVGSRANEHGRTSLRSDALGEEDFSVSSELPTLYAENCSRVYATSNIRRPVSLMFHMYRSRAQGLDRQQYPGESASIGVDNNQAVPGLEDMLYEPSLTYHSLSTIGRVKIKWVDTLTAHLSFQRATRTLSVYRYPSFCVTKVLAGRNIDVLESITNRLLPPQPVDSSDEPASVYQEVLLSYRLLFAQSKKSRKIVSQLLPDISDGKNNGTSQTTKSNTEIDSDRFLRTLCTTPLYNGWSFLGIHMGKGSGPRIRGDIFPASALNVRNELIESDSYSALDDFPIFGSRLLALQRYNKRRQPTKITDLWRDRRNPLQWYTFWVVAIIGGFGLLLALLQLIAGFVQMAYAIKPSD